MPPPVAAAIALAYGSLLVELTVFPVPSESSCRQLLAGPRSRAVKILGYLLPTAVGVALFAIAPAVVLWPLLIDHLLPIAAANRPAVAWAGVFLILGGRALTFTSAVQLRAAHGRGELQASGLFARSRNPGLLGMYAWYLGHLLCFPCWVLLLGSSLYFANMHHRVHMEEAALLARNAARYRDYLAQVPRYFPRLR